MDEESRMPPLPKGMSWKIYRMDQLIAGRFYFKLAIMKKYGIFLKSKASTQWLPLPSDANKREDYVLMQAEMLVLTLPIALALPDFSE